MRLILPRPNVCIFVSQHQWLRCPAPACLGACTLADCTAMACESDDRACRFCLRPRTDPNPYTKGPQATKATFPFWSATSNVCVSCRAWFRCADMVLVQREALLSDMVSNQNKRSEHIAAVQEYERKVNGSANGRISRGDLAPARTVNAVSSDVIRLTTPLGVFWPEAIYKATTGLDIPATKLCVSKGLRGIIRDSKLGCEPGCWHVEQVSSHGIEDTAGLLSSETAMRDGQLNDVYQRAVARLTFGVKRKEINDTEDGEVVVAGSSQKQPTKKQLRAQQSDGGSSGDWLGVAVKVPLKCAAGPAPETKSKSPAKKKAASRSIKEEAPVTDPANGSTDGGQRFDRRQVVGQGVAAAGHPSLDRAGPPSRSLRQMRQPGGPSINCRSIYNR